MNIDEGRNLVEGMVRNKSEVREWIKNNVTIRWITINEFDTCTKWAEHFAIAVLRPKFNK